MIYLVPTCPLCKSRMDVLEDTDGWTCDVDYAWHSVRCKCANESCGYEKDFREVYQNPFYEDDEGE